MGTEAGPAIGVQIGVPANHQQAQPAQAGQDRAQRQELTQVELTRPTFPALAVAGAVVQAVSLASVATNRQQRKR